jgi:hypothetical protein
MVIFHSKPFMEIICQNLTKFEIFSLLWNLFDGIKNIKTFQSTGRVDPLMKQRACQHGASGQVSEKTTIVLSGVELKVFFAGFYLQKRREKRRFGKKSFGKRKWNRIFSPTAVGQCPVGWNLTKGKRL